MPNFPAAIRAFLNDEANWTEIDPAFADVEFPQKISRNYLLHASRVGRNLVWVDESRGMVRETQTQGMGLCQGYYDIFSYSRAKSSAEADVEDAENKAENMRDICSDIVKANWNLLSGAFFMRPQGTYPLAEYNIDPVYFVKVLTVEVFYEI